MRGVPGMLRADGFESSFGVPLPAQAVVLNVVGQKKLGLGIEREAH